MLKCSGPDNTKHYISHITKQNRNIIESFSEKLIRNNNENNIKGSEFFPTEIIDPKLSKNRLLDAKNQIYEIKNKVKIKHKNLGLIIDESNQFEKSVKTREKENKDNEEQLNEIAQEENKLHSDIEKLEEELSLLKKKKSRCFIF